MQRLYSYLPQKLKAMISVIPEEVKSSVCELRLRTGGVLSLSTYTKNLFLTSGGKITTDIHKGYVCQESDITDVVSGLTEGSVYRYMNTINSGYIVTGDGIRVGIAGEAVYTSDGIASVSGFSSLNIRLPHDIDNSGDAILGFIRNNPGRSILLCAPAGWGKTTVIRSVAKGIALGKFSNPQRVSVIDERGEILPRGAFGLIDRLNGYSKPDGIEIAARLFSPEYIICDEIGLHDDVDAILSVQNIGIPFIATTHGRCFDEIVLRPNIKKLVDHKVFSAFAHLERHGGNCITVFEEKAM